MGIFTIRSKGNNVTNRIVGSSGVRNARNERPPLRLRNRFGRGNGNYSSVIMFNIVALILEVLKNRQLKISNFKKG